MTPTHWMARAACGLDPGWTTMTDSREREMAPSRVTLERLAAICAGCPVITDCAAYALERNCTGGMYAGVWVPLPRTAWGGTRPHALLRDARRVLAHRAKGLAS